MLHFLHWCYTWTELHCSQPIRIENCGYGQKHREGVVFMSKSTTTQSLTRKQAIKPPTSAVNNTVNKLLLWRVTQKNTVCQPVFKTQGRSISTLGGWTSQSYDSRKRYKFISTILVLFLEFHPGWPGWNFSFAETAKFGPVTEPARPRGLFI